MFRNSVLGLSMVVVAMVNAEGFNGTWNLLSARNEKGEVSVPSKSVSLALTGDASPFTAAFHAANRFMGSMEIVELVNEKEATVQFGPMAGTRMMPPPQFQDIERFISMDVPELTTATIRGRHLILAGSADIEAVFKLAGDEDKENA